MELQSEVIGLDIGRSQITAVRLIVDEDTVKTVGYWRVGLPQDVWNDGNRIENRIVLQQALKELRSAIQPKAKRAYIGISHHHLLLSRALKPRALDPKELHESIRFDLEASIPYAADEAQISYTVLGPDPHQEEMQRILSVVCNREVPVELIRAVQSAGFQVVDAEPQPCILHRGIEVGRGTYPELLVSIGKRATSAIVINNSVCEYAQNIDIGGEHLTELLHKSSQLSLAGAEQFKLRHSLIGPEKDDPFEKERGAMVHWADRLVEELYSVLVYQEQQEPVRRIVLTGGGAQLDGLLSHIARSLGVPAEMAAPIAELQISEVEDFACLTTAYSLALKPAPPKKNAKNINVGGLRRKKKKTDESDEEPFVTTEETGT